MTAKRNNYHVVFFFETFSELFILFLKQKSKESERKRRGIERRGGRERRRREKVRCRRAGEERGNRVTSAISMIANGYL